MLRSGEGQRGPGIAGIFVGDDGLCRDYHTPDRVPSRACFYCGHTMWLHPGVHNPALEVCVICEVRAALSEPR